MAEFPSMPLWTDAYLADTSHLTTIEHGAYLLLLMIAWRTQEKRLPDDDKLLARYAKMTPSQWKRIRPVMSAFFKIENGYWTQGRLIDEANAVKRYHERQVAAGKASALKRKARHSTTVELGSNLNQPPTPTPIIVEPKGSTPPIVPHNPKARRGSQLPSDWQPILTDLSQRIVDGWPPGKFEAELRKFKNHAADKGRTSKDWQAAFRTWIENSNEWMKQNGSGNRNGSSADNRDGLARALDRIIDAGDAAQPAHHVERRTIGDGRSDNVIAIAPATGH